MTIKSSDYRCLVDNSIYIRSGSREITISDNKKIPVRCLIIPERYTTPTPDNVISYLKVKCDELKDLSMEGPDSGEKLASFVKERFTKNADLKPLSTLEKIIIKLPDSVNNDIIAGNETCIKFIKENLSTKEFPGEHLRIKYGLIPSDKVKECEGCDKLKFCYPKLFSIDALSEGGLGEIWNLTILLSNGTLPERERIDYLLKERTSNSKILRVSRFDYSLEEAREVIDFAYNTFKNPRKIEKLKDCTVKKTEERAVEPILSILAKVVEMQAIEKLASKAFKGILDGLLKETEEDHFDIEDQLLSGWDDLE
jgi:hypothetical protein